MALSLSGCFGIFVAEVPAAYLTGVWERTGSDSGTQYHGLGTDWAMVQYESAPRPTTLGDGPYPASLAVFSIETPTPSDREEVAGRVEEQVRANAASQDLVLTDGSRITGERTVAVGLTTSFFAYRAKIGAGSGLFEPGRDARVIGEVWYDEPSRITVIVVGLAQVQGSGAAGQYFVDSTSWSDLVRDPSGSIDGMRGDDGLIYRVRSH